MTGQLARYAAVGVGNTLVSLAVYTGTGSSVLAFAAGAVNGYLWNARWTFAVRGSKLRYLVVQLAGLGLTFAVTRIAGYLVALPIVTLATFAANRAWAFPSEGRSPRWTTATSPLDSTSTPRCSSSPAPATTATAPTGAPPS
jgi:putative flippase GtrA